MGGGHHHSPEAMPRAEQDVELLKKHQIPIALRDSCAHLLVPLNECQFIAWSARVDEKKKILAEAKAASEQELKSK
jgi:NADH-ubiquinone oxidoreductase B18 subunit (NDUFB7)